jgi:hypothetical protein
MRPFSGSGNKRGDTVDRPLKYRSPPSLYTLLQRPSKHKHLTPQDPSPLTLPSPSEVLPRPPCRATKLGTPKNSSVSHPDGFIGRAGASRADRGERVPAQEERLGMPAYRRVRWVPMDGEGGGGQAVQCLTTARINSLVSFYARASESSTQNNQILLTAHQSAPQKRSVRHPRHPQEQRSVRPSHRVLDNRRWGAPPCEN